MQTALRHAMFSGAPVADRRNATVGAIAWGSVAPLVSAPSVSTSAHGAQRRLEPAGHFFEDDDLPLELMGPLEPLACLFEDDFSLTTEYSGGESELGCSSTSERSSLSTTVPGSDAGRCPGRFCDFRASAESSWGQQQQGAVQAETMHQQPIGNGNGLTTVMVQRLPYRLSEYDVCRVLDSFGFAGAYDAIAVPSNHKREQNLGYAFINFTHPMYAKACIDRISGRAFSDDAADRACYVVYSNNQGSRFIRGCLQTIPPKHRRNAKDSTAKSVPAGVAGLWA